MPENNPVYSPESLALILHAIKLHAEHRDKLDDLAAVVADADYDLQALASGALAVLADARLEATGKVQTVQASFYLAYYLGYLAGRETGDLSLWEEQLNDDTKGE